MANTKRSRNKNLNYQLRTFVLLDLEQCRRRPFLAKWRSPDEGCATENSNIFDCHYSGLHRWDCKIFVPVISEIERMQ